jgi:hypothetical protein
MTKLRSIMMGVIASMLFLSSMLYLGIAEADGRWTVWFNWNVPMHTPPPPQHYFPMIDKNT